VEQGVIIWQMYNMGIVVKTPVNTFACDVNFRGAERLVPLLDFATVSHTHSDHNQKAFLDAMVRAGKPVYSPHWTGGTIIEGGEIFTIGEIEAAFRMSQQANSRTRPGTPCILSQFDCGPSANNYNIYHTGDATIEEHYITEKPVDVLVIHSKIGIDMQLATQNLNPKILLLSHFMELGHGITGARWTYAGNGLKDVADYNSDPNRPCEAICMTWGERLGIENAEPGLPTGHHP
jgi:L-ascorbate metabolism protein UlaG (beta-lactamase superfamily)